jgi:hypothetical protein
MAITFSQRRFSISSTVKMFTPVALLPGRARARNLSLAAELELEGAWRVEYFESDGAGYITIFAGQAAELRARDYYDAIERGVLKTRIADAQIVPAKKVVLLLPHPPVALEPRGRPENGKVPITVDARRWRAPARQPEVSQAIKIGEKIALFATKSCCSICSTKRSRTARSRRAAARRSYRSSLRNSGSTRRMASADRSGSCDGPRA